MPGRFGRDLVKRCEANPLLTPDDIPNVVFSSGAIMDDDGTIRIYYGAADTCICLGTARIEELMQVCAIH